MDKISQMLKQNKPDITDSSIRAYTANLSKLHSRLHGSRDLDKKNKNLILTDSMIDIVEYTRSLWAATVSFCAYNGYTTVSFSCYGAYTCRITCRITDFGRQTYTP